MKPAAASSTNAERLKAQLNKLLQGSLGLNIYPDLGVFALPSGRKISLSPRPLVAGLEMTTIFLLLFVALPSLLSSPSDFSFSVEPLLVFQVYGALWSGWATASTRIAHRAVFEVIEDRLMPALSGPAAAYVADELERNYNQPAARRTLFLYSWFLGAGAAVLAGWLVNSDLPNQSRPSTLELAWWCVGWTLLYTTSAKVVIVSRFYGLFAEALVERKQRLFSLDSASSAVVASIASIGKYILLFWLAIAVSIALIIPFGIIFVGILRGQAFGLDLFQQALPGPLESGMRFMMAHLVATAVFSIGVGSFVFLRTEAVLRRAVATAAATALRKVERMADPLFHEKPSGEADPKRLAELRSLHAEITRGGVHRTVALSGLSLAIPFLPVLTLLLKWLVGK